MRGRRWAMGAMLAAATALAWAKTAGAQPAGQIKEDLKDAGRHVKGATKATGEAAKETGRRVKRVTKAATKAGVRAARSPRSTKRKRAARRTRKTRRRTTARRRTPRR